MFFRRGKTSKQELTAFNSICFCKKVKQAIDLIQNICVFRVYMIPPWAEEEAA